MKEESTGGVILILLGNCTAYYDRDKIDVAFAKVRSTLQRLSLCARFFNTVSLDEPDGTFGIRNDPWAYQKYEKLEYLEISVVTLFGNNQTWTPVQLGTLIGSTIRHWLHCFPRSTRNLQSYRGKRPEGSGCEIVEKKNRSNKEGPKQHYFLSFRFSYQ